MGGEVFGQAQGAAGAQDLGLGVCVEEVVGLVPVLEFALEAVGPVGVQRGVAGGGRRDDPAHGFLQVVGPRLPGHLLGRLAGFGRRRTLGVPFGLGAVGLLFRQQGEVLAHAARGAGVGVDQGSDHLGVVAAEDQLMDMAHGHQVQPGGLGQQVVGLFDVDGGIH